MGKFRNSQLKKLSKTVGRHADGDGLYMVVRQGRPRIVKNDAGEVISETAGKVTAKWALFYFKGGKRKEMTLGDVSSMTLATARETASDEKTKVTSGADPIAVRKKVEKQPLFGEAIETFLKTGKKFRTDKTRSRWAYVLMRCGLAT